MAAAYLYAEGSGPCPREIEVGMHVETFGAAAVLGRVMGAGELRRIAAARNVVRAYQSRMHYRDQDGNENWVEWTNAHPELARILNAAEQAVEELDNGE